MSRHLLDSTNAGQQRVFFRLQFKTIDQRHVHVVIAPTKPLQRLPLRTPLSTLLSHTACPHTPPPPTLVSHTCPSPFTCLSRLYMGPSPSDAGHLEALASAAALREDQVGLPGGAGEAGGPPLAAEEEAGAEEEEEEDDALPWPLPFAGAAAAAPAPALPAPAAPALPCLLFATAMRCSNRPPLLLLSSATALALASCSFTATTLAAANTEAQGKGGGLGLCI